MAGFSRLSLASLVAIAALTLASCGGATGGSPVVTPPPAPTPTPTSTPTPAPTSANADLIAPLASETFSTQAATVAGRVNSSGFLDGAAASSAVTFAYNAGANSYTISASGRSQTFGPGDVDSSLEGSGLFGFTKTNGSLMEFLSLTVPTVSGAGGFQYVGSGFWQKPTSDSRVTVDAFTYGAVTPASALPTTGSARFELEILGVGMWQQALTGANGIGNMTMNFANGTLAGQGSLTEIDTLTKNPRGGGDFSFGATLAAGSNTLSGTFNLYPSSPNRITGPLVARFFGPNATEFGATFAVNGDNSPSGPGAFVGTLMGLRTTDTGLNNSLLALSQSQLFTPFSAGGYITLDAATRQIVGSGQFSVGVDLKYDAGTGLYSVRKGNDFSVAWLTTAAPVPTLSNSRFQGYSGLDGGVQQVLQLYRVGPANPEFQLTYTSFGRFSREDPPANGQILVLDQWFHFGMLTDPATVPRTGSANYSGRIYGTAMQPGSVPLMLTGTSQFAMDFQDTSASGSMRFFIDRGDGSLYDLGTVLLPSTGMSLVGVAQAGIGWIDRSNDRILQLFTGGYFYGPNGQEFAGNLSGLYAPEGTNGASGRFWGVHAAKRD